MSDAYRWVSASKGDRKGRLKSTMVALDKSFRCVASSADQHPQLTASTTYPDKISTPRSAKAEREFRHALMAHVKSITEYLQKGIAGTEKPWFRAGSPPV